MTTWTPRTPASAADRLANLRRNAAWTLVAVQGYFLLAVAAVYIYAQVIMTGEPFHDLGVMLGREMLVNDIVAYWFAASALTVAGGVVAVLAAKHRWTR